MSGSTRRGRLAPWSATRSATAASRTQGRRPPRPSGPATLRPSSATATTRGRLPGEAAARLSRALRGATGRFTLVELLLWASLYPAYLAIRGSTIGDPEQAFAHASRLIDLERSLALFHEGWLQQLAEPVVGFLSVYYMAGFGPLIVAVLVWLGVRHRTHYRDLRSLLFVSLGIAVVFYVLYPTAPPRLVPGPRDRRHGRAGGPRHGLVRRDQLQPVRGDAEHARRLEPPRRDRRLPRHLEPRPARPLRRPSAGDGRDRDGDRQPLLRRLDRRRRGRPRRRRRARAVAPQQVSPARSFAPPTSCRLSPRHATSPPRPERPHPRRRGRARPASRAAAGTGDAHTPAEAMVTTAQELVGRPAELDVFDGILADLEQGLSGAIELVGEPGIGKTRLLAELAARADGRGLPRALRLRVGARARSAVLGLRRRARRVRRRARPTPCSSVWTPRRAPSSRTSSRAWSRSTTAAGRRSRTSATARTAPCASCSSCSPRRSRSC